MKQAITNQLKELKHSRVSQQIRLTLDVSGVLFEAVRGWVSHHALRKVQEQRQLYQKPNRKPCSQTFTLSHGLPCSHTLKKLDEEKRILLLEHFHPHWHWKRDEVQPLPILEPRRAVDRLSLRRIQPVTSSRREPSGFELVERSPRIPRKCSRCHAPGHVKTSKHCPLRRGLSLTHVEQGFYPAAQLRVASRLAAGSVSANVMETAATTSEQASRDTRSVTAEEDQRFRTVMPTTNDRWPSPITQASVTVHDPATSENSANTHPVSVSRSPTQELPRQLPGISLESPKHYESPEAVYRRYVAARGAWYAAQPAGSVKTNQQYRSAMKLPHRYDRKSYEWCLHYKQMSRFCITSTGSRAWTKEEMMAYLDWSKAEDDRIEAQVANEMGQNPLANRRRGVKEI